MNSNVFSESESLSNENRELQQVSKKRRKLNFKRKPTLEEEKETEETS
jgi:hypothetical protein